ncbi:MAG: lipocalin family protein [Bacteroidales bacterium]|jgi:hypothetical protein|nr:lipocalin family protein [Bacteroidales bacterium]
MNKRLFHLFIAIVSIIGVFAVSCTEKDQDEDIITGKWRSAAIVNDTNSTPCKLQYYIEFSDYVYQASKRFMNDAIVNIESRTAVYDTITPDSIVFIGYNYQCQNPIITRFNYSINTDTLIITNIRTHGETKYIIQSINADSMVWKSLTTDEFSTYYRWD